MNAKDAHTLYDEAYWGDYTSMKKLLKRIEKLATAGGYVLAVRIDSSAECTNVWNQLLELGYQVELCNPKYNDTLEISWG